MRARSRRIKTGQLAQAIVGNRGTAGAHGAMAGGQIALRGEEPEGVAGQIGLRALEYLKVAPHMSDKPLI